MRQPAARPRKLSLARDGPALAPAAAIAATAAATAVGHLVAGTLQGCSCEAHALEREGREGGGEAVHPQAGCGVVGVGRQAEGAQPCEQG